MSSNEELLNKLDSISLDNNIRGSIDTYVKYYGNDNKYLKAYLDEMLSFRTKKKLFKDMSLDFIACVFINFAAYIIFFDGVIQSTTDVLVFGCFSFLCWFLFLLVVLDSVKYLRNYGSLYSINRIQDKYNTLNLIEDNSK